MLDREMLERIKNNDYSEGEAFPTELHELIHAFYEHFDLDKQDSTYRETYIRNFIEEHEAFIVNYVTNIYQANIKTTDKLSDEVTFCKFLDTVASYLTKYYEDRKDKNNDDFE